MADKSKIAAGTIAAAILGATTLLNQDEGNKLTAYPDTAGIWSACRGIANVPPHSVFTQEQCDDMNAKALEEKTGTVVAALKEPVSADTLKSLISFTYNVGSGAFKNSSVLKLINQGKVAQGCRAMLKYHYSAGEDCIPIKAKCHGLWTRRQRDEQICLKGISQ